MNPIFSCRRFSLARAIFFSLSVLLLSAGIAASREKQADLKDAKIDSALSGLRLAPPEPKGRKHAGSGQTPRRIQFVPIFVRMTDQLIGQAGEYEKFCQAHQRQKRSELRAWVLKTLRQKSDKSWKQIADHVDQLAKEGMVKNVQRLWIVNGFSCIATQKAVQQLAALDAVEFVYLDHDPSQAGGPPLPLGKEQKEIFEQVLQEWKDDSDEPFSTDGLEIPWNLQRIQADAAWKEEKVTGKGVVVAVCDSGLMRTPSLVRALWKNPKKQLGKADTDGNGYTDDLFGYDFENNSPFVLYDVDLPHGSMCAGIIAGRPLNSKKLVTGIAPRSRVMVLRGNGLKMYEYAMANGADVLSMSYGVAPAKILGNYRGLYRTAFEHLTAGGVVASGGVGNHGQDLPKPQQIVSPKDIPCVLGTAGILENGKHPPASSTGPCYWEDVKFYSDYPKSNPLRKPDVTAPFGGFPVWGRPGQGKLVAKPEHSVVGEQFTEIQALVTGPMGNSFSCPHTAGVAALVLSANPELNAWEVKQIMEQTCKDLGDKSAYGAGLLQALDAVRAAKKVKK